MSRFQPLAAFQRDAAAPYTLLPMRFMRLPRGRTLVTNMVGEGRVLEDLTFQALVTGTLAPSNPSYGKLRASHVLREEGDASALELLALKTRTRYERLRNFTGLHIFVVSLRCDHSCPYCQVSRQSSDRQTYDMTEATALKAIDLVFRSPNPALKIEFQGGEPLLNFDLIRQIVKVAEERNQREQRNLQFVIATTLSLATTEMLEFCRDHKILLSTSLDGPRDLHNANRPRPGRDSHERLEDGLRRARDIIGVDAVSALMTTSPASLNRVTDIVDEYLRLGFEGMCSDCAFEPWCGAEPVFHHATFGNVLGRKPESEFCKRTMGVIQLLLEKLEDPRDAEILRDWVRPC